MGVLPSNAIPHRPIRTRNDGKLASFVDWAKNDHGSSSNLSEFLIQLVKHPNFEDHKKDIRYYKSISSGGFEEVSNSDGFRKCGSYKNFTTKTPEADAPKGWFFEINLLL